MAYQVLARKWRPQSFDSLIGQEPIVTALRNALAEQRIAQAYLFSGIRGVGKTTAARVLAKALNCETGPTATPCNECVPCREITQGSDMDVIEVDAATYSKVEQVRELTESLKYGPARDRYKVVVIDEIHRLSRQAFDALLKIVEEPPAHLLFVFATTEIEAVPPTILSRCQEFHFRRVPSDIVAAHLRYLCEAEAIEASDTALRLVARAGEGSVRDSVALLDQLATFGGGAVSDDEAVRLLGGLDLELFRSLLSGIASGQGDVVRQTVARIEEEGWDPRSVFTQFLAYCRDGLHLSMGRDPDGVDLPREEADALREVARGLGYENLLRLMHLLLGSEHLVRRSEAGALAVEIAWLKAAELPKLTRVEELLGGAPPTPPGESKPDRVASPTPPPAHSARATASNETPSNSAARASETAPASEPNEPSDPPSASSSRHTGKVGTFLEEVRQRKQPLAAHLDAAEKLEFDGERLLIYALRGDTWLENALHRASNRQVLEEAIQHTWGEGATWTLLPTESQGSPLEPENEPDRNNDETERVTQDATVQKVLDLFGGTVEAVDEHQKPSGGSSQ